MSSAEVILLGTESEMGGKFMWDRAREEWRP